MSDTLFDKIIRREIPADIVAESEHALAFRDIMPVAPTHVLVVPKLHEPNAVALAEADPSAMGHLFQLVGKVVSEEGLDNGYRAVFNTGADALQTVFHAHLHVLGGRGFEWPPG